MPSWALPYTAQTTDIRLLLKINVKYPDAQTLYFTDLPVFDAVIEPADSSVGMASMIISADITIGMGQSSLKVALRNTRYLPIAGTVIHADLAQLLTKYAFHGASAEIVQYVRAGTMREQRTLIAGTWVEASTTMRACLIENVTDVTPSSITFELAQAPSVYLSNCPRLNIARKTIPAWNFDPPNLSKGLTVPVRVGQMFAIPDGWTGVYVGAASILPFIQHGVYMPGLQPARLLRDEETGQNAIWADGEQPSTLHCYDTSGSNTNTYAMVSALNSFGRVENAASFSTDAEAIAAGYYSHTEPKALTVRAHLIPSEIGGNGSSPTGVTNQARAVDRKMDTYCMIEGTNVQARWVIPSMGNPGTIRPSGWAIKIRCFTATQPPNATHGAATGTFRAGIKNPYASGDAWLWTLPPDVVNCATTGWTTSMDGGGHYPSDSISGMGWPGTRFQEWEFQTTSVTDTSSRDNQLYIEGYEGLPFELCVQLVGAGRLYLIAVAMEILFLLNRDDYVGYVLNTTRTDPRTPLLNYVYGPDKPANPRNLWVRTENSKSTRKPAEEPIDPEGHYTLFPPFHDTSDTYGGGADVDITTAGAAMNFFMRSYTSPKSCLPIGEATATFGCVRAFDAIMNEWVVAAAARGAFKIEPRCDDAAPIDGFLDEILAECPGVAMRTVQSVGRPAIAAMGPNPVDDLGRMAHTCAKAGATGLTIHRDILAKENGIPRVEIQYSRLSDVANDFEIRYDYDAVRRVYRRIATCNSTGSDDGYGLPWGVLPGGHDPVYICGVSEGTAADPLYGKGRKQTITLPFVSDRGSALAVGMSAVCFGWRPQATIRFHGPLSCQDILPGQLIKFNEDMRTVGGINLPILWRDSIYWTDFYWYVTSVSRQDSGGAVYYEVFARETTNGHVGPQQQGAGLGLEQVPDGFDG